VPWVRGLSYQSDLALRKASAAEIRGLMEDERVWATRADGCVRVESLGGKNREEARSVGEVVMAESHECETPLDGLIQHRWKCKKCGKVWEVVGQDDNGNPEWEEFAAYLKENL